MLALSLLDQMRQHPTAAGVTLCIGEAAAKQGGAGDTETPETEGSILQKHYILHV